MTAGHFGAQAYALLADGRADPSANDSRALRSASVYGCVEVVQALLADGRADPSANVSQAIRWASQAGYVQVVRLLVADGRADRCVGIVQGRHFKRGTAVRACVSGRSAWFASANCV